MTESDMPEKTFDQKVSIIIPVYNREMTLPRLFASLLNITYRPLEIVLVDNHSHDRSWDLCQDFLKEQQEDFTLVLGSESHPGACAARNKGIALATGDYLYFFDSDDEISSSFLSDLMPYFPQYDVICAPTMMRFPNGSTRKRDCVPTAYPHDHILSASLSTQSFIIKKSFLENIGNWEENIRRWNDWELGVRILCHRPRLKWLPEKAYHTIYQHAESISGHSFTQDYPLLLDSLKKAETDITTGSLSPKLQQKALHALIGKHLLLAAQLYREGQPELAQQTYHLALSKTKNRRFKAEAAIVYFLGQHKVPGLWRLLRYII